ncbi:MAG: UspA protein [Cyanobacteria bacterium RYN_339]|nr:UspA protein [Cyanobacteria bacterium RYN_339]
MIIVFGVDGSIQSRHAIREAARLLPLKQARLFAVAVASVPPIPVDVMPGGMGSAGISVQTALLEQAEKASLRVLAEARGLFLELGLEATTVERLGSPAEEVLALAHEVQADLIVVGAHSYGPLERFWRGSVSDQVAHRAPGAVLVVHLPAGC